MNAKDINILLGREELFPQRLQNSGCSWKNKHQKTIWMCAVLVAWGRQTCDREQG